MNKTHTNCCYFDINQSKEPCKSCNQYEYWKPIKKTHSNCKYYSMSVEIEPCKNCYNVLDDNNLNYYKNWEPYKIEPKICYNKITKFQLINEA